MSEKPHYCSVGREVAMEIIRKRQSKLWNGVRDKLQSKTEVAPNGLNGTTNNVMLDKLLSKPLDIPNHIRESTILWRGGDEDDKSTPPLYDVPDRQRRNFCHQETPSFARKFAPRHHVAGYPTMSHTDEQFQSN